PGPGVAFQRQRERALPGVSVARIWVAHHVQNVTVRKIGKYLFGVQDHDRTVTEIRLLHAGALRVLPAIERRAEKRLEQQGPRARLALHEAHEQALAFALVDL